VASAGAAWALIVAALPGRTSDQAARSDFEDLAAESVAQRAASLVCVRRASIKATRSGGSAITFSW
jgi:hypothetical protein